MAIGSVDRESARLVRTAVWDDVSIGRDAELTECIVCDGARVPGGSRYERSVLLDAARLDRPARERVRIDNGLAICPF
jgi:NDP-sugar pyrophosphorylase family protein